MRLELQNKPIGPGRILGFSPTGSIYACDRHDLIAWDAATGRRTARVRIPTPLSMRLGGFSRLYCRLRRYEIRGFAALPDGGVIAATRSGVYHADAGESTMRAAALPSWPHPIHPPMTMTVDRQSRCFWGEYWSNREREQVGLFCSHDRGASYEPAWTFSQGEIRHIHSILEDPFEPGYWVMTGDEDNESGIGFLSHDFKSFDWLIHGSQQKRAVVVFVFKDRLVYATDTEKDFNFIYACDRATGKIEKICDIPGSCIYGCTFGKWHVISTTVENFHKFDTNLATLWVSSDGTNWHQVWQAEKDRWPKKYFQYGSIILPRVGWDRDEIVFSGQALKQYDGRVHIARIIEED